MPGEQELADKVKQSHEQYATRAEDFWNTTDVDARRKMYFGEMLPTFTEIKDTAQEIIRINQDNMVEADREARELSAQSTRYMILAIVAGHRRSDLFRRRLQRSILAPIHTLTAVSKELGEGKLDQVVPVASQDELGQLADTFNKMATKLRAYRQAMGDQILQARQMTEITFSAFPDPIIALTPDGRIDFTNPAANKFLYQIGQQDGLPPAVQAEVDRVFKGAPDYLPTSFEKVIVFRVDDHEVFMLPRVIGMRDEAGHIFGAAVYLQDVTRLRLLDEVKSNLVSTVSHELKTPLTSVRMGLHLLLEERIGTLNAKQTELLLAAREDSERLLRMINDLLDLAKLESGKVALPGQPVEPKKLDRERRGGLAGARRVPRVAARHGDRAGAAAGTGRCPADRARLFQLRLQCREAHQGRRRRSCSRAKSVDGKVRFSVIDHGPGIPQQYQAKLFDRFFRVPGSEVNGAGLGLTPSP